MNNDKFILTPDAYTQEEWCEMYINVIKEFKKTNDELNKVNCKLLDIIHKNINNIEVSDDELIFIDYYMNKCNALWSLINKEYNS